MNIKENEKFSLQFTGSTTNVLISIPTQLADEIPVSASLTITRIVLKKYIYLTIFLQCC